jgi:hypothetical protein
MKKYRPYFLLFLMFTLFLTLNSNAQSYDKKVTYEKYDEFDREITPVNKINITSYVTKQNILTYVNYEQIQKTVSELPKYRYELVLISKSLYNNKITKTWIYGAKVFIDGVEVTRQQFPNGFTAIIETEPTVIYWYETSSDKIDFKITWENSIYFRDNK